MKTTVLTSMLMGMATFVCGQSAFTFTPNDTVIQSISDNSYTQIYIYEENQTTDSLTLGVEIVSNEIPASWDGMVCIYGFCLTNFPMVGFTSEMATIHDTINGYVRVTANPMGSTESGTIRVKVFDVNNPIDADTCTFIIYPEGNTSIQDHELAVAKVYPNPASDLVTVSAEKKFDAIRILALNGAEVFNDAFRLSSQYQLTVNQLPIGSYFIELRADNATIARKQLVVHE